MDSLAQHAQHAQQQLMATTELTPGQAAVAVGAAVVGGAAVLQGATGVFNSGFPVAGSALAQPSKWTPNATGRDLFRHGKLSESCSSVGEMFMKRVAQTPDTVAFWERPQPAQPFAATSWKAMARKSLSTA